MEKADALILRYDSRIQLRTATLATASIQDVIKHRKKMRIRYTTRKDKAEEGTWVQAFRAAVAQIPALCATTRQGMIPLLRRFGESCHINLQ